MLPSFVKIARIFIQRSTLCKFGCLMNTTLEELPYQYSKLLHALLLPSQIFIAFMSMITFALNRHVHCTQISNEYIALFDTKNSC